MTVRSLSLCGAVVDSTLSPVWNTCDGRKAESSSWCIDSRSVSMVDDKLSVVRRNWFRISLRWAIWILAELMVSVNSSRDRLM